MADTEINKQQGQQGQRRQDKNTDRPGQGDLNRQAGSSQPSQNRDVGAGGQKQEKRSKDFDMDEDDNV